MYFQFVQCLWTTVFTFSNSQIAYSPPQGLLGNTPFFGNEAKDGPGCDSSEKFHSVNTRQNNGQKKPQNLRTEAEDLHENQEAWVSGSF